MKWLPLIALLILFTGCSTPKEAQSVAPAEKVAIPTTPTPKVDFTPSELEETCLKDMAAIPGPADPEALKSVCAKVKVLPGCKSVEGHAIYHYDRIGIEAKPRRILAKALIHGDEIPSGSVSKAWMARLESIDPRNSWRVIPLANPDGYKRRTRTNANGVDINRNFPTKNWEEEALGYWKNRMKSDPRRYPGKDSASEPETRCLMDHFKDFQPDFIISIHTPLGVLDFDGPKISNPPKFHPLPWISLGNFPGSLGRFMWADKNIPVLTIELKSDKDLKTLEDFDRLQDISGTIAIQADKLKSKTKK